MCGYIIIFPHKKNYIVRPASTSPHSPNSPEKQRNLYSGDIALAPLMLSVSTHSWRHVSQHFMPLSPPILDKECFHCPFQFSIKLLLWGRYFSDHCWTLGAIKHVPWSEEMLPGGPNWCNTFSSSSFFYFYIFFNSSSFIVLRAFASTTRYARPSPKASVLFLSEPICSLPVLPASFPLASYVQGFLHRESSP